jgi:methylthioribulose-1-phosphate dehydratase
MAPARRFVGGLRLRHPHGVNEEPFPLKDLPVQSPEEARRVICALGRRFYGLGWVSGTGGGISLKLGDRIYMAPSGVQKELLTPEMIFELDGRGEVLAGPPSQAGLAVSQCRPLFLAAMDLRGAGAVIHSHSRRAVLATLAFGDRVTLSRLEMLKGLRGVGYDDVHEIPIVENTAHESDLTGSLVAAMHAFPQSHAVLVRRHGIYVWGGDWREAKRHAECYDYLLDLAVEMRRLEGAAGA